MSAIDIMESKSVETSEETRKKRDCPEKERKEELLNTLPRSRRSSSSSSSSNSSSKSDESSSHGNLIKNSRAKKIRGLVTESGRPCPPIDLESSLNYVVNGEVESISPQKFISYRVGHAGDSSTICSLYRKTRCNEREAVDEKCNDKNQNSNKPCSVDHDELVVRLASALGDEDTPPSVFALMAEICSKHDIETSTSIPKEVAAVALVSFDLENLGRILRVEWLYVDKSLPEEDLVKRRLWLRLSALALSTRCHLHAKMKESSGVSS
jgi:hypothetical protein